MTSATEWLRADYDETPYVSNSFPQSAPGALAAIAALFGLRTAALADARVLEIGCAAGGNLVPFAVAQPGATVVGVDLSQVQIDLGRARATALGLENLELIAADIATVDVAALGTFDFVIAHGVYSWVPPEVQEALLRVVKELLAPDGVAYVSYNTYPGWKTKEILRDAMMLASGASVTPANKVSAARGMADFLEEVAEPGGVLAKTLEVSREHALGFADSYLLHDELETFNAPCYFYQFVGRAQAHGLAYLAESHPETMLPGNFGPRVAEYVAEKCHGVQVLIEQYLDFVLNRMYRESLLVHAERAPQIRYDVDRDRLRRLHVAALVPPVEAETVLDQSRQEYRQSDGATLFTNDPGIKAALDALSARWPWTISRDDLVADVCSRLVAAGRTPGAEVGDNVDDLIGVLVMQGTAYFRVEPVLPPPAEGPPRIGEVSRRLAGLTSCDAEATTFNAWHETLVLSPLDRHVLPLLDGSRDRAALLAELTGVVDESPDALADYLDALPAHLKDLKLLRQL